MKKVMIYFVSLVVFLATVFSCCFMPVFEATASTFEQHDCHQHVSDHQNEHHPPDAVCDCPEIIALINDDISFEIFQVDFVSLFFDFRYSAEYQRTESILSLTNLDPPDRQESLYLKHSVFRI